MELSQRRVVPEQEPVGIVISRGRREEWAPKVVAYIWGAAPEVPPAPRDGEARVRERGW